MKANGTLPEALGISSAGIMGFLDALDASGLELHGLILMRHGQVACDMRWTPYNGQPHQLFSLTKSFTSTAIGFAEHEGLLSLSDRVVDLLPDKLPENPDARLQAITVEHLLMMGSGLAPESDGLMPEGSDWARHTLSFPVVHEPGTVFHYNSQGSHLLSVILHRVAGETLRDYLMPRLFAPLGIETPPWETDPQGDPCGGWGLYLTTEQISRFGRLLVQDGVWEGRQLLPKGWVSRATAKHIDNAGEGVRDEWSQGYGYQFWRCRNGYYRGDGMHGQVCWVMPQHDAIIAITAGLEDMGAEMALLQQYLIPAIDAPAAEEPVQRALQARIAGLGYAFPARGDVPADSALAGTYFNPDGAQRLSVRFEGDALNIVITTGAQIGNKPEEYNILAGPGSPMKEALDIALPLLQVSYLAAYGWVGSSIELVMRMPNAPFYLKATLTPDGDGVLLDYEGLPFGKGRLSLQRAQA